LELTEPVPEPELFPFFDAFDIIVKFL
jgi:hypothetical protein